MSAAKTRIRASSGILLVDKPQGWTSHDVVAKTRSLAGTRKVGHAGTLDPMATGLLVLGIESSTRLLTYVVGVDKEYRATIRLGATTVTDDAEGEIVEHASPAALAALTTDDVRAGIAELTGRIQQVPSAVSAIKVDGKRSYARVRAGEEVELAAREITVSAFELLGYEAVVTEEGPGALDLMVRVECSSGTYIRALARDLGARLGVGGYLTELRRTRVGPFSVTDAAPLDGLEVASRLIPPARAAATLFESVVLEPQQVIDMGHGKKVELDWPDGGPVAAISPTSALIGLLEFKRGVGRSLVNFPADEVVASAAVSAEEVPAP